LAKDIGTITIVNRIILETRGGLDKRITMSSQHAIEIKSGNRFAFGDNWSRFLTTLNDNQIHQAEQSLCDMLQMKTLQGKRFLDIGSGSGLFSLAARRLGATVHSFDYDPQSVACTEELKRRYFPNDSLWSVEQGSALDENYLSKLGCFDIVYSWGVLHHTSNMHMAFSNVIPSVAKDGYLVIAIYNDQGFISRYWTWVKRNYNKNIVARFLLIVLHAPYLFGMRWLVRALTGRLSIERGMSLWHDMVDWLGGYPFEAAKPEKVFDFFRTNGFTLEKLKTCGGRMGCNEFVFRRRT
jgi:2-polyprenyl-6-hydroxyphenyl methylase/3-demethylubiquinone-9 3-methyltransferase